MYIVLSKHLIHRKAPGFTAIIKFLLVAQTCMADLCKGVHKNCQQPSLCEDHFVIPLLYLCYTSCVLQDTAFLTSQHAMKRVP